LTRSGYGDQYIRLCTVHETWFKGDDELWNFIHRGGDGAAGFKKLTQSEIIKVTKPKKSTQEWEVKVNFRIDPTWYEGALENNMDAAGNGVVDNADGGHNNVKSRAGKYNWDKIGLSTLSKRKRAMSEYQEAAKIMNHDPLLCVEAISGLVSDSHSYCGDMVVYLLYNSRVGNNL
jgi:hypothetical protein